MQLKHLFVRHFRNLRDVALDFSTHLPLAPGAAADALPVQSNSTPACCPVLVWTEGLMEIMPADNDAASTPVPADKVVPEGGSLNAVPS